MIAELGNYALALSLAVSFFLAIFPLWGAEKGHPQLMSLARPMTYGLFFSLTIAFAALFYLFAVNDFSVQYVVNNSKQQFTDLLSFICGVGFTRGSHYYFGFGY